MLILKKMDISVFRICWLGIFIASTARISAADQVSPSEILQDQYKNKGIQSVRSSLQDELDAQIKDLQQTNTEESLNNLIQRGNTSAFILEHVGQWASFESINFKKSEDGEKVPDAWNSLFDALRIAIITQDDIILRCKKLSAGMKAQEISKFPQLSHNFDGWLERRRSALFRMIILAKTLSNEEYLKSLFALSSKDILALNLGSIEDIKNLRVDAEGRLAKKVETKSDVDEVTKKRLIEFFGEWFSKVSQNDIKSVSLMYEDPSAARRYFESNPIAGSVFPNIQENVKKLNPIYDSPNRIKIVISAQRMNPISLETTKPGNDLTISFEETFEVVLQKNEFRLIVSNDDGVEKGEKEQIREMLVRWAAAVTSHDKRVIAEFYTNPDQAKASLENTLIPEIDLSSSEFYFKKDIRTGVIHVEIEKIKLFIPKDTGKISGQARKSIDVKFLSGTPKLISLREAVQ